MQMFNSCFPNFIFIAAYHKGNADSRCKTWIDRGYCAYVAFARGGERALYFFGDGAKAGQGILEAFDAQNPGSSVALTINGAVDGYYYKRPGQARIYFRGSKSDIRNNPRLLLHEVVHLVYPSIFSSDSATSWRNLDHILITKFDIDKRPNESDSRTVSRFFNTGCRTEDRFGNSIP